MSAPDPSEDPGTTAPTSATFVDLAAVAAAAKTEWTVHPVADLHAVHVGLAVIEGTYYAHNHTVDPELFVVLEGRLLVHMSDGTRELVPSQALLVPPGVTHLSEATERTVVLNVKGRKGETVEAELDLTPREPGDSPHLAQ